MLLTNQRLDKMAAARVDFVDRGMLPPSYAPPPPPVDARKRDKDDDGWPVDIRKVDGNVVLARTRVRNLPRYLKELADHINEPDLLYLTCHFLFEHLNPNFEGLSDEHPTITSKVNVFWSAVATFYAPSDDSGIRGMHHERICSTPCWRNKYPRHDCAFVVEDDDEIGFRALCVVRVKLFFSFEHNGVVCPCALVEWFRRMGCSPDPDTGMWKVKPEYTGNSRDMSVLHLDTFLRGAHLLPVFGTTRIPVGFHYSASLDVFKSYYVNKYIDHLAHEMAY